MHSLDSVAFALRSTRVVLHPDHAPVAATVVVRDGRIAAIHRDGGPAGELPVHDLGDFVVMPGIVDTHAHVNEPGRTQWEGFETATRAAAAGGITTLVDMPLNSIPPTTSAEALAIKMQAAAGHCRVDHAFWGGLVPGNAASQAALIAAGALGSKAFLIESGVDEFRCVGEDDLRAGMRALAAVGAPLLVHAELDVGCAASAGGDARQYSTYVASRPSQWEVAAIRLVIRLARETGCAVHVVHLSAADALPLLAEARAAGLPITVETCPHYLTLAAEDVPDGATHFKCAPPIRGRDNQERLWDALGRGVIDAIVSDHSPCTPDLKHLENGDFAAAWGGIAGLQLSLPVVWTEARRRGRTVGDLSRWMCAGPARIAGIAARKGAIALGLDADFVVWDPEASFTVEPAMLHHRHAITPYAGRMLYGVVRQTWVRGICVYDGGAFPGAPIGEPLRRAPALEGGPVHSIVPFTTLLDLAGERLGGRVLFATDDFFAPKENLLKPGPAVFVPGKYTERGKWMDGWESRRKRVPGHDWCVIRLGAPGAIHGVNVDTAHFLGNFPPFASIEAAACTDEEAQSDAARWTEILPRVNLRGGVENLFPIADRGRWTHLRLHIEPDGGVARFRAHGIVLPDWEALRAAGDLVDLGAAVRGGTVVTCNDMFFGPKENLLMPGRAASMSDGWETRRRRVPGNDWIVLRLGNPGRVRAIEVDTAWFKGNFPESCAIDGVRLAGASPLDAAGRLRDDLAWENILPRTPLHADDVHVFEVAPDVRGRVVDHVRLSIYPDGGVSRLRLFGEIA